MKIVEQTPHRLVLENRPAKCYWWVVWVGAIGFSSLSAFLGGPMTQGAISSAVLIATHEHTIRLTCDRTIQECQVSRLRLIGPDTESIALSQLLSASVEIKRPDRRPPIAPEQAPPPTRRNGRQPQPHCQLLLLTPLRPIELLPTPRNNQCSQLTQAASEINQFLITPTQSSLRLSIAGGEIFWAGVFVMLLTGTMLILIPVMVVLSIARYYDRVTYCQFNRGLGSFILSRQKPNKRNPAQPLDGQSTDHALSHSLDEIRAIVIEPVCAPLALWNLQVVLHNDQRVALLLLASGDRLALTQLAQDIAKFLELPQTPAS